MPKKQARGEDTKKRILMATLEVIKSQGMRAVRHRAVAAEAGVPLGSTTYHFKSIEDLIVSTFVYWHEQIDVGQNPKFLAIAESVTKLSQKELREESTRAAIAEQLYKDGYAYLKDQIIDNFDDRRIELAFHNEALRNSKLSGLLLKSWQNDVNRLVQLYTLLGTCAPVQDAEITFAIIMQSEKRAMLLASKEERLKEYDNISLTLKRHVYMVLGLSG